MQRVCKITNVLCAALELPTDNPVIAHPGGCIEGNFSELEMFKDKFLYKARPLNLGYYIQFIGSSDAVLGDL